MRRTGCSAGDRPVLPCLRHQRAVRHVRVARRHRGRVRDHRGHRQAVAHRWRQARSPGVVGEYPPRARGGGGRRPADGPALLRPRRRAVRSRYGGRRPGPLARPHRRQPRTAGQADVRVGARGARRRHVPGQRVAAQAGDRTDRNQTLGPASPAGGALGSVPAVLLGQRSNGRALSEDRAGPGAGMSSSGPPRLSARVWTGTRDGPSPGGRSGSSCSRAPACRSAWPSRRRRSTTRGCCRRSGSGAWWVRHCSRRTSVRTRGRSRRRSSVRLPPTGWPSPA